MRLYYRWKNKDLEIEINSDFIPHKGDEVTFHVGYGVVYHRDFVYDNKNTLSHIFIYVN